MDSAGNALLLWIFCGVIALCIVLCWLELGLTVPLYTVQGRTGWDVVSAPCNGADKNYVSVILYVNLLTGQLEYIYKRPMFLMTCMFGILFLLLGNLAGNAIQFGVYVLRMHDPNLDANSTEHQGAAIGIGIVAVSACALLTIVSRKGAIWINNALAVAKITMLVVIFLIGANKRREMGTCQSSFEVQRGKAQFGDIAMSMIYALYPYSGYDQPFYVLAEVSKPRKKVPVAVIGAMLTVLVLYPLVHWSYFCVVRLEQFDGTSDILTVFIKEISGRNDDKVEAASAIIAIFIFGNIFVQTYTAARVKQEIAKEGILPFSKLLSTQHRSPWEWIKRKFRPTATAHEDETPIVATLLHWASYGTSFAAVCWLSPNVAYKYLTFVHSYVFVVLLGSLTGGGLLYLKLESLVSPRRGRQWARTRPWTTPLGPLPALVYFGVSIFLVFACFAPVRNFTTILTGRSWIATLVGFSSIFWGMGWWGGLRLVQWMGQWTLKVRRTPYLEMNEDHEYVRRSERIQFRRDIAD
jgi:amino acid transporter